MPHPSPPERSPRTYRRPLANLLALSALLIANLPQLAHAAVTVPIWGGNIQVESMGAIPYDRIRWLVQTADRSSCTSTPLTTDCDGFMSPGDRVVIGDNYMAFMDLTRTSGNWGNGGGGLLRGFWMLKTDGSGNKNFKYISNSYNRAPNNLFPFQNFHGGDAHEILALLPNGSDPVDTYRASESASVTVWADGQYNSTNHSLYYHFQGVLTRGDGAGHPYTTNIGSSWGAATMYYHVHYWFYNDYFAGSNNSNAFKVQARLSVDLCGSTGCNQTSLKTLVFSLGLSDLSADSRVRVNYFKPISDSMIAYNYPTTCTEPSPSYLAGTAYSLAPSGTWWASKRTPGPFSVKYSSDSGSSPLTNFRVNINNSTVSASGVSLTNKIIHQMVHDSYSGSVPVITYDIQAGDPNQCGAFGMISPNNWVQADYVMAFEYETP